MLSRSLVVSAAVLLAGVGTAAAHTAYLLPRDFTPDTDLATIEAAWGTTIFAPEVGLGGSLGAVRPDGQPTVFHSMRTGSPTTVLELTSTTHGTYRISSGEQLGSVANMVGVDGGWRPLGAGEVPPEGAPLSTLQTVTVAETYITKGPRPTESVLANPTGRLAIRPITHPNRVATSTGFEVELLFDGRPFPNMPFVLYGRGDPEADLDRTFVTNEQGRAMITFDAPGQYLLAIRHRANAPAGAAAQVHSYTTTLSFEVVSELPPIPPPPEDNRRRRRNRDRD